LPQSALHLVRCAPCLECMLHKRQGLCELVQQCLTLGAIRTDVLV